ncbi:hypothetical protein [Streptomyces sp. T028]|uniref:hypothetical protein n=1 Tax=Streptomyces sp. T028 TaxID=3394379 RepID=UPI003A8710B9
MQEATPNPTPGRPDELRELLAAVLEALDIPYAATVDAEDAYRRTLEERAMHAKIALCSVLEGHPLDTEWTTAYLRERLAEHPPTGYVTVDQARAALAEGKTWAQAVQMAGGEGR